jgi:hypothetical protein
VQHAACLIDSDDGHGASFSTRGRGGVSIYGLGRFPITFYQAKPLTNGCAKMEGPISLP